MTRSDRSLSRINIPSLMALALLAASMMAQVQAPKAPKAPNVPLANAVTDLSLDDTTNIGTGAAGQSYGLVFFQTIGSYRFTCNTDANLNPYADCLNTMVKICNSSDTATFDKTRCQSSVDEMFGFMNSDWQSVRQECGQWSPYESSGNPSSAGCAAANSALQQNGYYLVWNPITRAYVKQKVTEGLTKSLIVRLWSNPALIGL